MAKLFLLISFLSFSIPYVSSDEVYSFHGNPYSEGPLQLEHIELSEILDSVPAHMTIYFPSEPGYYVPIVIVPGLFGVIYAEWYSDVFKQIAAHGYIVIGVDTAYPALHDEHTNSVHMQTDPPQADLVEKLNKTINWLIINLNENVLRVHELPDVKADWSRLGLAGHSAGCDTILKVVEQNRTIAKAIAFIEPFSYAFKEPLPYSLPALCYGTQYSEETPKCIYPDYDYRHFYGLLKCPKILMNVTGFGHCDILNEINWETCRVLHFCKTVKSNNRTFYRTFIAGVISAFFGGYLQDNLNMLSYITNEAVVPAKLGDLKYEIKC